MNKVKVTVGGSAREDATAFIDAWHRIEAGEAIDEHCLSFQSLEGLMAVLTTRRFEILKDVHNTPAPSVAALAKRLHRNYRNVYDDVSALTRAGLLSRSGTQVKTEYDVIEARMTL
jgi:predicted transcriptional regulator